MLKDYQKEFIDFCIDYKVVKFGNFTLKSGRKSNYFFNVGLFNTGDAISRLGAFYADAIVDSGIDYDIIFGPAYKGIPLVVSCVIALSEKYKINKYYCFNRKVVKNHGEGGNIVGADLKGRVLIIDDVITAGTAVRETLATVDQHCEVEPVGVIVALDRQEKGEKNYSAIKEIERKYGIRTISIIKLTHLMEFYNLNIS